MNRLEEAKKKAAAMLAAKRPGKPMPPKPMNKPVTSAMPKPMPMNKPLPMMQNKPAYNKKGY